MSARRTGFRRRDALHAHSLHFGPNMTPMVDIVMCILIFFMASAAFLGGEWFLKAAIPFQAGRGGDVKKPNDPNAPPPVKLDVALDADASGATLVTFLELRNAPLQQFLDRIAQFKSDPKAGDIEVVIRPSPKVNYADVVRAHAACDEAGIYKIGIGVSGNPTGAAKP